ncbi:MAG: 5-formyltetrahydrofolate cyclo-ligase [Deltaproteobacteria bacterium]|nr:5-formyltetrahydrofolate cyclo-ligase [Deltaproteobacteria bacterium]MBW2662346.1 5-formyltetrahydrofolate cyclo-ligase [Deltaproteobacteria bacterium]
MEEIQDKKRGIRISIADKLDLFSVDEIAKKTMAIENRLFEFANFIESKIVLLYMQLDREVATQGIIERCFGYDKIVVLPAFNIIKHTMKFMKVDNLDADMKPGPRGVLEPDPARCNVVPVDCIDIAIIPGVALDEKGGRIGSGDGYYDRLIPKLSATTRKVSLAFESQIIQQVPLESHDKYVDIVITDERIIYKI